MAAKKKPRRHRKKQSLALRIESVRDSALVAKHQAAALCEKALEGIDSEDFSGEEFLPLLERFSQPKAVIWVVLHLNSYTETLEKLKSMVEQIEKISSHDWLVAEQWIDFLELEMKLPELREEILTRMQGDLEAVQAKFEAIMKSRMAAQIELFLQKNKCGKVEEAEEILCLQALLISLEMNGRKSRSTDSAWRQNVLQSKSVHEFKILLRKLCDIQVSEMIPAWDDLSKFWINAVAYSTRLTDLAPVILFLEYFLNEADTSQEWQCQKIPWSSAGLKLSLNHPESTALLYFIQILILVESVCSISGLNHFELEQFLTHRDSLSLEMLCSALLNVVVDLENSSPLKFVNAWKNLSFVWKARISNCDSFCAFAELLFELESYIRVCAFEHHWFEIRPSWLKCLNLTSISIEKIKSLALRFESCINGKSFKVEFQDPSIRRQWRYHASNSSNVLDIGNLIVDLESRIDPMHYGLIWKDYRSFWRYNAKATVFPSQLAFSISEMYSLTQIPVIKGWAENHQRFVTELKDLAIGDSFGRNSIVQGMIFFFKLCLAEENFSDGMFNLLQDDWKSALCFARTSEEIGHSWIALVASIKRKLHLCPKLRNSMPKVESLHFFLDIRIVSRSIYQIVDKMSQSVMKPAWNQYKGRVSSLLKLVNKDQPSEMIVNVIKTYIALIEQNLEPCAYHSSWNSISQLWAAGLLAQSSLRSVFFYFAFLVQNFLDVFSGEKFLYLTSWMTFASTKSTSPGSISALILATVSLIQPNYYFSRWSMVSRTLRIVLSFICFSEEIGKGEYIKFSLATHPCLGDQHDKILNLVCSHVSSDEFMDSVAEITNSNYRISSLASAALAVLANSSPINSNAHFQDAEYNLKVLSGEISDNSRTLRIIQSLAAIIFSSLSIHLFIDTSFMSSVGFNEADSSSEQCLNESIYKYFLSEVEIDVSLLVSRILRVLDSLSSDAFLMGLSSGHSEIFNSIKYALSKAETPWDIGAALRMIEMHIRRESFAIMFSQFWEIARLGFLCVLKHIELSHLQPIKMFQRRVYELDHDESGHTTRGHLCIDDRDREEAAASGSDLLFGELLTDGVAKALDHMHLDVSQATTLCDLGMGIGKLAIQSWISHKSLKYVLGVELARTRYEIGEKALLNMVEMYPDAFKLKFREYFDPKKLRIAIEDRNGRVLEFRKQNLFLVQDEGFKGGLSADIIITETHFPEETTIRLCKHLSKMKSGARLLTYENLHECYNSSKVGITMPFKQLEINRSNEDKFPTTWSTVKGHHFYLWRKE